MLLPGRKYTAGNGYRYGFNGKEDDDETGWQDYGMRIYDPRLGRFLSEDPITEEYPELTPYQFASNTPIQAIDLDGLEAYIPNPTANLGVTATNFFIWLFSDDVDEIKDGSNNIFEGIQKQADGPRRGVEYNKISNDKNSDYRIEEYNAIRKADGKIQSIVGTVQVADGITNIGAKGEAIVTAGISSVNALGKTGLKNAGKTVITQVSESDVKASTSKLPIKGYTKHGLNQAIGRDGGRGVKPSAILDAVKNPKKIIPGSSEGSTVYKGAKAKVVLNEDGKVITTAGSSRGVKQRTYHSPERRSGSGSAQRKANSKGFSYNPNAIH